MRHGKKLVKLNRKSAHRKAMFRNMATSLLDSGKIETTVEKAKGLRPIVEKLITVGKTDTLHSKRKAASYIMNRDVLAKLFTEVGPKFAKRNGGYTRIVRTRSRAGDAADMAFIELLKD